jgi:Spy/CpxP family protein refolding chaperone
MRHPWRVPLLVAMALAVSAAAAQAQPGSWQPAGDLGEGRGPGMPPQGRGERMARDLGLSEAQQDKLREIMDEQRAQREALFEKLSANRDALHQLLESGSADANAVGELVLEGRKLHEESRALREAEQKAIRSILTLAQQKKFDQALAQRRERGPGRGPQDFQGRPPGGPAGTGTRQPRPPIGTGNPGQLPLQP